MKPTVIFLFLLVFSSAVSAQSPSLMGSPESMNLQAKEASKREYTLSETFGRVGEMVDAGVLVWIPGDDELYELYQVSIPFARPEVKDFIESLAEDYLNACGSLLTVTSLTRPKNRQPENSHSQSVHPAGMAVDLRIPKGLLCQNWLEERLLSLEGLGEVEATEESTPPHYHIAVFGQYSVAE